MNEPNRAVLTLAADAQEICRRVFGAELEGWQAAVLAAHLYPQAWRAATADQRQRAAPAAIRTWRQQPTRGPRMRLRLVAPGWGHAESRMRAAYRHRQLARRRRNRR